MNLILLFSILSYSQQQTDITQSTSTILVSTNSQISLTQIEEINKIIDDIKIEISHIDTTQKENIIKILKDAKENLTALKNKRILQEPQKALLEIRKALISYYIKLNRYPSTLDELVPNFIPFIPEIKIHSDFNSSVKYIRTNAFDKDYTKAIDSSTEYLYFADQKSIYWGFLIINSTREVNGIPYYKY